MYAEADGLLSKKIQQLQGCPCTSAVIVWCGWRSWCGGLRQHTGALFTPRPKMTNSINSRHLSGAPMESNTPDKRLKGFFLVALTYHLDSQYQYLRGRRISFHLTSMLWHCEKVYEYVSEVVGLEVRLWWGNWICEMTLTESVPNSVCVSAAEQTGLARVTNRNSDGERATISLLNLEAVL